MNFSRTILFLLLTIPVSTRAQNDSLTIILGQNDNFLSIDKSKIKIQGHKYSSDYYNFDIDVPSEFTNIVNKGLPNGCIFSNTTTHADFGFWVSHYATMRYSKKYCFTMTKKPEIFKRYYREYIFKNGVLADSKFLSDTIRIIKISGIPAIQYTCTFIKEKNSVEFIGQMVLIQLFYKSFNYRFVSVVENEPKYIDAVSFFNKKLLESFRLLKTNE